MYESQILRRLYLAVTHRAVQLFVCVCEREREREREIDRERERECAFSCVERQRRGKEGAYVCYLYI